jgi:hypothetical protein
MPGTALEARSTHQLRPLRANIEKALTMLAFCGGSPTEASERLGGSPTARKLTEWKRDHREHYARICEEIIPQRAQRIASEAEDILVEGLAAQREALRRTHESLDQLSPSGMHSALRNIAIQNSLLQDKLIGPLRGMPSQVIEVRRNETELWAELQKIAGTIPGQAQEIEMETPEPQPDPTPQPPEPPPAPEPAPEPEPSGPTGQR